MNKKDAALLFEQKLKEHNRVSTREELIARIGKTTLRVMWVDYLDFLAKNGDITDKQAHNWTQPVWIR